MFTPKHVNNFRTRLKILASEKHSSLFSAGFSDEEKVFFTLTPEPNVIKLFLSVNYGFSL
jgi:hypothetical protein